MAAIILAVLTGVLWAVGELLSKSVFHSGQIGPITAIAVRGTVALPLLWGAWVVARFVVRAPGEQASVFAAEPVVLWKLVGASLLAGGLAMIFFYTALSLGELSRVKPIAFALAPALAVLLGWLVLGESLTVRKGVAVVLIVAGVLLLAGGGGRAGGAAPVG